METNNHFLVDIYWTKKLNAQSDFLHLVLVLDVLLDLLVYSLVEADNCDEDALLVELPGVEGVVRRSREPLSKRDLRPGRKTYQCV